MASNPYLELSKEFGIDYGDLLLVAEAQIHQRDYPEAAHARIESIVGPAIYDFDAKLYELVETTKSNRAVG